MLISVIILIFKRPVLVFSLSDAGENHFENRAEDI